MFGRDQKAPGLQDPEQCLGSALVDAARLSALKGQANGGLLSISISLAFFYLAATLRTLLVNSSEKVINIIRVCIGLQIASFAIIVMGGTVLIPRLGLGLLLGWYLIRNVKRLAAEQKLMVPAPAASLQAQPTRTLP